MLKHLQLLLCSMIIYCCSYSQQFETLPPDVFSGAKPLIFGKMLCTNKGTVLIANSLWYAEIDNMQIQVTFPAGNLRDNKGNKQFAGKNSSFFRDMDEANTGIKLMCEGPGEIIYFVDENNNFGCMDYKLGTGIMMPPFNLYSEADRKKEITSIWISDDSDLYAATNTDTIYFIAKATRLSTLNAEGRQIFSYEPGIDKDSNFVAVKGALPVKKFTLGKGIIANSFSGSNDDKRIVLIGTNKGMYGYDKQTGQTVNYFNTERTGNLTITNIKSDKIGLVIWFSTLEKGMGRYNTLTNNLRFFPYPKKHANDSSKYPINNFSIKSPSEFFVAAADSLPAVFNTETGVYTFISDTTFHNSANKTTDIQADPFGNLYIIKAGSFYFSKTFLKNSNKLFATDSALIGPYITDITINGAAYDEKKGYFFRDELIKQISLSYNESKVDIFYSCRGVYPDSLIYGYKLDNYDNDWTIVPFSIFGDKMNLASYRQLKPGTYTFHLKARDGAKPWFKNEVQLIVVVAYPFWQTWWFWLASIAGISLIVFVFVKWRVNAVRKKERLKAKHEKELMELEARALRAQMNPHFIFNCMNSIKSLVQKKEEDKAVNYLTTFSKLIRTIFQNSDKREISLFDEIETCKLYTQLESMRFGNKFSYQFNIDEGIDLKSFLVPALIIQPFIENAIWHGIMPKEDGGTLTVNISKKDDAIVCIIDDNGIGREMSKQNKFKGDTSTHQSKGVHLTQSRLDLDNALNQRNAAVETLDKRDTEGRSAGTTVIITFKEY